MVSYNNTDGSNCQFCVNPECYFAVTPGETIPSNPISLAPGADNGNFDSFYNSDPGDGANYPITYQIRFFMIDSSGNEVGDDIAITYNYTPENFSTRNFDLSDLGISMQNTVVQDYLILNTESNVTLRIFDLNSKLIKSLTTKNGTNSIDLSNLSTGYYISQFTSSNNKTATVKILKQ
jgi:hypothetical protein